MSCFELHKILLILAFLIKDIFWNLMSQKIQTYFISRFGVWQAFKLFNNLLTDSVRIKEDSAFFLANLKLFLDTIFGKSDSVMSAVSRRRAHAGSFSHWFTFIASCVAYSAHFVVFDDAFESVDCRIDFNIKRTIRKFSFIKCLVHRIASQFFVFIQLTCFLLKFGKRPGTQNNMVLAYKELEKVNLKKDSSTIVRNSSKDSRRFFDILSRLATHNLNSHLHHFIFNLY
ncbi:hypothetical protein BpHYR1_027643 [Brachionus plicatilis]|uniref:Uncharacterized protein n=1 Tax=Brachionus plicatilis TaxID=10195 RepID=A0A3M7S3P5_BRAPC|nr:hypothetical protein BpHYR1_027643 [Brachionus plicatilis]